MLNRKLHTTEKYLHYNLCLNCCKIPRSLLKLLMQLLTLLREYFGLLCCKITYSPHYLLILLITILLISVLVTPLMLFTFLQVSVGNYNYVIISNTFNYKGIMSLFTGHIVKCFASIQVNRNTWK